MLQFPHEQPSMAAWKHTDVLRGFMQDSWMVTTEPGAPIVPGLPIDSAVRERYLQLYVGKGVIMGRLVVAEAMQRMHEPAAEDFDRLLGIYRQGAAQGYRLSTEQGI
jgi:hypothetical protein